MVFSDERLFVDKEKIQIMRDIKAAINGSVIHGLGCSKSLLVKSNH
jgi:hypothetical protein